MFGCYANRTVAIETSPMDLWILCKFSCRTLEFAEAKSSVDRKATNMRVKIPAVIEGLDQVLMAVATQDTHLGSVPEGRVEHLCA